MTRKKTVIWGNNEQKGRIYNDAMHLLKYNEWTDVTMKEVKLRWYFVLVTVLLGSYGETNYNESNTMKRQMITMRKVWCGMNNGVGNAVGRV